MEKKLKKKRTTKKSVKKKIRFKKISFSISEQEKLRMSAFCKQEQITINKLLKTAIREYLKEHRQADLSAKQDKKQLDLFRPETHQFTIDL